VVPGSKGLPFERIGCSSRSNDDDRRCRIDGREMEESSSCWNLGSDLGLDICLGVDRGPGLELF